MAEQPQSSLRRQSRFITAHHASGKTTFSNEISEAAPVRQVMGGDMEFSLMYTTKQFPVSMADDQDIKAYNDNLVTPPGITVPGGTVCRTVDFPPGYTSPMHRTQSCDYGVVLEGEMELILDSGEVRSMKRGDVAVQRGTSHAWRNVSKESWARMFYVLQSAEKVLIGGQELAEDEGGID